MSGPRYSIIPGRAVEDKNLKLSHLKVLLYLGRFTDNNGWCFIYQEKAGECLGISRETVNRCLGDLEKWQYLIRKHINRYGKKIAAVRVFLDHGQPELPNMYPIDGGKKGPDFTHDFHPGIGHNSGKYDDFSPAATQQSAGTCEPQITGRVSDRSQDVCATDHRMCDAQLTCDAAGHTTCDPGDHTERLNNDYKNDDGGCIPAREDSQATTTTISENEILFDEFCSAAKTAGFVQPLANQKTDHMPALQNLIDAIGFQVAREALAFAVMDDLCCGRGQPSPGFSIPWRLTLEKFCDAHWLAGRLAEWRANNPGGPVQLTNAAENLIHIKIKSPDWFSMKNFYEATGQDRTARIMEKSDRGWAARASEFEAMKNWENETQQTETTEKRRATR